MWSMRRHFFVETKLGSSSFKLQQWRAKKIVMKNILVDDDDVCISMTALAVTWFPKNLTSFFLEQPRVLATGRGHLVRQKVANYRKEVFSQAKKMWVGWLMVQITVQAKRFTSKTVKWLHTKSLTCSALTCFSEKQFQERSPVLHLWQMCLFSME